MICGHMRVLGEERVLHVCIKTDIVHEDEHLMIPWQGYAEATVQHAQDREVEVPEWFGVLDVQARQINRQELIKALREDPMLRQPGESDPPPPLPDEADPDHVKQAKFEARQRWEARQGEPVAAPEPPGLTPGLEPGVTVPRLDGDPDLQPGYVPPGMHPVDFACHATRKIPPHPAPGTRATLQQCGNRVVPGQEHEHGNWQDQGLLPPEPEPESSGPAPDRDGYPLGRSQGDTWQQVAEDDPDAWKPPDNADRSVEPPAGGTPEADLGYAPGSRGKPPRLDLKLDFPGGTGGGAGGTSMASVAEVKAALDATTHAITEAQGLIQATTEKIGEAEGMALAAADGSGHDAVATGNAFLAQAKQDVEGALQTLQAAIESYGQYSAGL
jgi:hypothetical protein